jgi:hypothetical protein
MARYQILYWRHIPLGVRAVDINGVARQNLPALFQDNLQAAAAASRSATNAPSGIYTTSGFRWSQEQDREGSAAEVVKAVIEEVVEGWDEARALATYEAQKSQGVIPFVDLKNPEK